MKVKTKIVTCPDTNLKSKVLIHNDNEYKLNITVSPYDERDWNATLCMVPLNQSGPLPDTLDYRSHLGPARDQKSEGSCASFAATAMKEVQENIDLGFKGYFAPQFVYNQREGFKSGKGGMYTREVMNILYNVGVVREKEYQYGTTAPITEQLLKEASNFKINHYARVNSVMDAKAALFQTGPLLLAIPVYGSSDMARMWFPNGRVQGGHMVCIVGWNSNSFIVRNSWGADWNDNGYCYFPFDDWAYAWEVWSTTDAESKDVPPEMLLGSVNFMGEKIKK
jgi:C1A family cysteine protease